MGRAVFRASLPWFAAAVFVGLHFEHKLATPPSSDQILIEEQTPPRRAPKAEPESGRPAPPMPV